MVGLVLRLAHLRKDHRLRQVQRLCGTDVRKGHRDLPKDLKLSQGISHDDRFTSSRTKNCSFLLLNDLRPSDPQHDPAPRRGPFTGGDSAMNAPARKTYDAGVKDDRLTYWEPNYTIRETDSSPVSRSPRRMECRGEPGGVGGLRAGPQRGPRA